jgi:rhodanese-related sulfurtransferase
MTSPVTIERLPSTESPTRVPRYADGGRAVVVDPAWGTIQPLELAPGVRTVAELDVIAHLEAGGRLVDTRHAEQHEQATIPGAIGIPHEEILERAGELDPGGPTILFCNGPQCGATPMAVRALLDSGHPPERLLYYRGGIHDWMTLGLPVAGTRAAALDPTHATQIPETSR